MPSIKVFTICCRFQNGFSFVSLHKIKTFRAVLKCFYYRCVWIINKFINFLKLQYGRLSRKAIVELIYGFDYSLYRLWLQIYGEPDETDAVIFNELPRRCRFQHVSTNCPKKYCETCRVDRVIMYINRAKVSIDIAHLTFSHTTFYYAIASAWLRGVNIRLVTDSQMIYARGSLVQRLIAAEIPARCSPVHVMMHHKFCIIDGDDRVLQLDGGEHRVHSRLWRRKGYVMTGSLNWTKLGTGSNYENVVVTSNRVVNKLYQKLFDDMWEYFPVLNMTSFRTKTFANNAPDIACMPWKFWQ